MRFIIPLIVFILLIALAVLLVKYLYLREKNRLMKSQLDLKNNKEIEQVDLSTRDKKLLVKIFNKKIEYLTMLKKIKEYEFFYKRNEFFIGGINKDYDLIKVKIRKIKINGQSIFNVDILAWVDKEDFDRGYKPSKELLEIMIKEDTMKEQVLFSMNQFFTNKNKIVEEITINND